MYNKTVIEHFNNPLNIGELKGANGIGTSKNTKYSDIIKFFVKVDTNGVIENATFKSVGCVATIAISSALTEKLKGLTIEKATKLGAEKIANIVEGLPTEKQYCAILAKEALDETIKNYKKRILKNSGLKHNILDIKETIKKLKK